MADICANIEQVRARIANACQTAGRNPDDITLVAVSKTKPLADIKTAADGGHIHFGENRAQELQDKMADYPNQAIQWHMVGNLQTNKIKYMAQRVNWIHSVSKLKYLNEIEKRAGRENRTVNALIQVNISGEDQKSGCEPSAIASILKGAHDFTHVTVRGLMGMASFTDDMDVVRPQFKHLKRLFDEHASANGGSVQFDELSMGMTNDLEVAVQEGATMVRVGSAIFGERNYD